MPRTTIDRLIISSPYEEATCHRTRADQSGWVTTYLSDSNGTALQMVALTLAGIPTLLLFILCQRIIIRGIIIPQFK